MKYEFFCGGGNPLTFTEATVYAPLILISILYLPTMIYIIFINTMSHAELLLWIILRLTLAYKSCRCVCKTHKVSYYPQRVLTNQRIFWLEYGLPLVVTTASVYRHILCRKRKQKLPTEGQYCKHTFVLHFQCSFQLQNCV